MFERYYRELLGFLARKVGDREVAADLAQESYARVYAASGQRSVAQPRALLYTTARNLITDHYRRATVRGGVEVEHAADAADLCLGPESLEPEALLSGRQRLAAIEQALAELAPRPRQAFVYYKLDGLSRAEVAAKMGIGVKTVETHLEVAMQACLARLQALDSGTTGPRASTPARRPPA